MVVDVGGRRAGLSLPTRLVSSLASQVPRARKLLWNSGAGAVVIASSTPPTRENSAAFTRPCRSSATQAAIGRMMAMGIVSPRHPADESSAQQPRADGRSALAQVKGVKPEHDGPTQGR